jgi:antirestriction protein ArdC
MNIYALITARICASLEHGVAPWHRPWSGGELPKNLYSQHPYRGVNVWLLAAQPYASPYWATFRQIQGIGGRIRRDEHGTPVVFWKIAEPNVEPDVSSTQPETRPAPLLRYTVWNSEQCELPSSLTAKLHESLHIPFDPIPACEQIVRQMPRLPGLTHGGNQAVYAPRHDCITMPFPVRFARPEDYYATLYHELCHAAGHVSRLGRPSLQMPCPFGSAPYGQEELVAEMGAAFVCGVVGIAPAILDNTAAYLQFWLQHLRAHPRLLLTTAAQAQKAADYVLGKTATTTPSTSEEQRLTPSASLSVPLPAFTVSVDPEGL